MRSYGWIITRDLLFPGAENTDKGLTGPSSITNHHEKMLKNGEGTKFRMLDDDGNICYYGRIIAKSGYDGFQPLDDFGMPNAGCTEIQYKNKNGAWETL